MSEKIIQIADDFWNIRGEFKIGGVIDIGTHTSLVKRKNGKYLVLDAYTLTGDEKAFVDAQTHNGQDIEAIINLHPFHTVHVEAMHQQYPNAKLYGTARHIDKFPDLPWEAVLTESQECAEMFAEDLLFSIPKGVDFISSNEHLHFGSVLAYHPSSKTIHSDDTLMYLVLPGLAGKLKKPEVTFHMTLSKTLEKKEGAATAFREWAQSLAQDWGDAQNLCAAHSGNLLHDEANTSIGEAILGALSKVDKTLNKHAKRFDK